MTFISLCSVWPRSAHCAPDSFSDARRYGRPCVLPYVSAPALDPSFAPAPAGRYAPFSSRDDERPVLGLLP